MSSQETEAAGVFFKSDGTKMYVVGFGTGQKGVYQYDLLTGWGTFAELSNLEKENLITFAILSILEKETQNTLASLTILEKEVLTTLAGLSILEQEVISTFATLTNLHYGNSFYLCWIN